MSPRGQMIPSSSSRRLDTPFEIYFVCLPWKACLSTPHRTYPAKCGIPRIKWKPSCKALLS
jgi:hypothetical protein